MADLGADSCWVRIAIHNFQLEIENISSTYHGIKCHQVIMRLLLMFPKILLPISISIIIVAGYIHAINSTLNYFLDTSGGYWFTWVITQIPEKYSFLSVNVISFLVSLWNALISI
jgi:hypothetical protein